MIISAIDTPKDLLALAITARYFRDMIIPYQIQFRIIISDLKNIHLWRFLSKRRHLCSRIRILKLIDTTDEDVNLDPVIPKCLSQLDNWVAEDENRTATEILHESFKIFYDLVPHFHSLASIAWITPDSYDDEDGEAIPRQILLRGLESWPYLVELTWCAITSTFKPQNVCYPWSVKGCVAYSS